MTDSMSEIAIILVDYNSHDETKACLESLAAIKRQNFNYKIFVIDNGSKQSLKLSKKILDKKVEVIRSEANLGFTGGNNLGISYAIKHYNPDYLLLLNNDTRVNENFLVQLYKALEKDNKAGIATGKIYFEKNHEFHKKSYARHQRGKVFWYAGGSIDWLNLLAFHRGVDELDYGQFDQQKTSDFATGCCMLMKRELIEKVGLLDKRYFLYFEDVDYSLRAKKQGYKIIFVPQSVIWHINAGSSEGAGGNTSLYYQNRNRLLFAFKFGSFKNKITAIRILINLLKDKSSVVRQAGWDFILQRFGKQVIV